LNDGVLYFVKIESVDTGALIASPYSTATIKGLFEVDAGNEIKIEVVIRRTDGVRIQN
jgi:hypothetical protein